MIFDHNGQNLFHMFARKTMIDIEMFKKKNPMHTIYVLDRWIFDICIWGRRLLSENVMIFCTLHPFFKLQVSLIANTICSRSKQ